MAITLENIARNAAANAVVDQLDGGTIEIQDAGDVVLAILAFGTPAFGDAVAGVATANAIADDASADATGTATKFQCKTAGAAVVFSGTATTVGGGGDMELVSVNFVATQPVQLTSMTYTQPAA